MGWNVHVLGWKLRPVGGTESEPEAAGRQLDDALLYLLHFSHARCCKMLQHVQAAGAGQAHEANAR